MASIALRRVRRDLREIMREPSELFAVTACEDNMLEWHVNFFFSADHKLHDTAIHATFTFPQDFPMRAPSASFHSTLRYKHGVENSQGRLCLSILSDYNEIHTDWSKDVASWSPAYTMRSVLLNIHAFLFYDSDHSPSDLESIRTAAQKVQCACGHSGTNTTTWQPPCNADIDVPSSQEERISAGDVTPPNELVAPAAGTNCALDPAVSADKQTDITAASNSDEASDLADQPSKPDPAPPVTFSYAAAVTKHSGAAKAPGHDTCNKKHVAQRRHIAAHPNLDVNTIDGPVSGEQRQQILRDICCFATQENASHLFEPDNDAILGIGIHVKRNRHGGLMSVSTPCEYISYEAWQMGFRKSIFKVEMNYFLPLYINEAHYKRARPLINATLLQMDMNDDTELGEFARMTVRSTISERLVMKIFGMLLSSTVAEAFRASEDTSRRQMNTRTRLSARLIEGYLQIWRLLHRLIEERPSIAERITARIQSFIYCGEQARHKKSEPNLGALLSLLPFSSCSWDKLSRAFLEESFIRNVRWMVQNEPALAYPDGCSMDERLSKSFEHTAVSRSLSLFAKYMAAVVTSRGELHAQLLSSDARFGVPAEALVERILQASKEAERMTEWNEYLVAMDHIPLPPARLHEWLQVSLSTSLQRGYHFQDRRKQPGGPGANRGRRYNGPRQRRHAGQP
ncbi:uncharacterized protein MONBRDRAFT_37627 [Monosiga brevicollis MX1]|uniref:UBC core domain-containing protein n=1 Tax=Monosiga brevicollis TaxID=81824 RepID=A9V2X3_MONBE|nr:uncharacterized protein MONBRDRAFT_37627 [Monosiga brevicollis MX1]EDQ88089.1 predicted protein [Monosiga brevicollis MX1]|eukprot:XP_001747165.1 hypothetical protein [Monosiga brevicollis MX1]